MKIAQVEGGRFHLRDSFKGRIGRCDPECLIGFASEPDTGNQNEGGSRSHRPSEPYDHSIGKCNLRLSKLMNG